MHRGIYIFYRPRIAPKNYFSINSNIFCAAVKILKDNYTLVLNSRNNFQRHEYENT